jgi:hypothetical protein
MNLPVISEVGCYGHQLANDTFIFILCLKNKSLYSCKLIHGVVNEELRLEISRYRFKYKRYKMNIVKLRFIFVIRRLTDFIIQFESKGDLYAFAYILGKC